MSKYAIEAIRDALRDWAHMPDNGRHPTDQIAKARADLDEALRSHGVALSEDQLATAHGVVRQRLFMGGNFTLDARAVIAALDPQEAP